MCSWKLSILVVGSTCECGLHFENQMNGAENSESSRFDIMEMVENSTVSCDEDIRKRPILIKLILNKYFGLP